jgi:hypothetical protein
MSKPFIQRWVEDIRDSSYSTWQMKCVSLAIRTYYAGYTTGKSIFPGEDNLAKDIGQSRSSVQRGIAGLVKHGWLIRVTQASYTHHRAAYFDATFPTPARRAASRSEYVAKATDGAALPIVVAEAPITETVNIREAALALPAIYCLACYYSTGLSNPAHTCADDMGRGRRMRKRKAELVAVAKFDACYG